MEAASTECRFFGRVSLGGLLPSPITGTPVTERRVLRAWLDTKTSNTERRFFVCVSLGVRNANIEAGATTRREGSPTKASTPIGGKATPAS